MKISEVIEELARKISEGGDSELGTDFWIRYDCGEIKIEL